MSNLALLFPGQGSQHVGMGSDLARAYPAAAEVFRRANEVLGFDLSRIAWDGPEEELVQTQNAQPAILVHGLAVWAVLRERLSPRVRFAAGHSLGEFTAYAAAGSLDLEDAVGLVRRRGELMAESGALNPGTMAAIVGLDVATVREICGRVSAENGTVVPANHNSPQQIVISGSSDAVERAESLAGEAGARMVKRLPVSGAFHSPLMAAAEDGLRDALEGCRIEDPAFPIVANATADVVRDGSTARELLLRQLTSPVRWTEAVRRVLSEGVRTFVELGPGQVLTALLRRIDRGASGLAIGDPEGVRRLEESEVGA